MLSRRKQESVYMSHVRTICMVQWTDGKAARMEESKAKSKKECDADRMTRDGCHLSMLMNAKRMEECIIGGTEWR